MKAQSEAEIIRALYSAPLHSAPGSTWEYSNAEWSLLLDGRRPREVGCCTSYRRAAAFASYVGRFDDRVRLIMLTNGNDVNAIAVGKGIADLSLASAHSVRNATSGSTRVARRAGR